MRASQGEVYSLFDEVPDALNPDPEIPTPIDMVVRLTRSQREQRVQKLMEISWRRYHEAIEIYGKDKNILETCLLYSGGNDSTTIAHMFRSVTTKFIHANTQTGLEATRQFVRDVSASWGIELVEETPTPGQGYADFVRGTVRTKDGKSPWPAGFPGPASHALMFQRLKERGLDKAKHTLGVSRSRTDRLLWIAGRRRAESRRRATVPHYETKGTAIWVSPLTVWHKADLRTYRLMHGDEVPTNPVTSVLGMSGECGCLCNAKAGEAQHWKDSYPDDPFITQIIDLEAEIADREDIPAHRRRWGWGGDHKAQLSAAPEELDTTESMLCDAGCGPDPLLDLMDPLFELEAR